MVHLVMNNMTLATFEGFDAECINKIEDWLTAKGLIYTSRRIAGNGDQIWEVEPL